MEIYKKQIIEAWKIQDLHQLQDVIQAVTLEMLPQILHDPEYRVHAWTESTLGHPKVWVKILQVDEKVKYT